MKWQMLSHPFHWHTCVCVRPREHVTIIFIFHSDILVARERIVGGSQYNSCIRVLSSLGKFI